MLDRDPAGSGEDPPQDTAKLNCKADNTSGKTYLRKHKKYCEGVVRTEEWEKVWDK